MFKALFRHSPGDTEENHVKLRSTARLTLEPDASGIHIWGLPLNQPP